MPKNQGQAQTAPDENKIETVRVLIRREKVVGLHRKGCTIDEIADLLGLTRSTVVLDRAAAAGVDPVVALLCAILDGAE